MKKQSQSQTFFNQNQKQNMSRSEKFIQKKTSPNTVQNETQKSESFHKGSTNQILKLEKSERLVAINGFIEQLTSDCCQGNSINVVAANVQQMHQTKCDDITEKAILQLEERILKGIQRLNNQNLCEKERSKLLEKVLEEHVLYEKLRRERSTVEGKKSRLEESLESKENDWISKMLNKLGGLSYNETSFSKKMKPVSSNRDLLSKSYLSDADMKIEGNIKIRERASKVSQIERSVQKLQRTDTDSNEESKTMKLIKKSDNQQKSIQSYKQINSKLNFLADQLRQQSILLKDLIEERKSQQILESRRSELRSRMTKKSIEIPEEEYLKYKQGIRNRISIEMPEGSQNQIPYFMQRSVQTSQSLKYGSTQNQYKGYPNQININIKITPY